MRSTRRPRSWRPASTSGAPGRRSTGPARDDRATSTEERGRAAIDVFKEKLIKRDISLKAFEADEPASGKVYRITGTLAGHQQEKAKKIAKVIRDEGPKGVKAQIQGDQLRVCARSATTCRPSSPC